MSVAAVRTSLSSMGSRSSSYEVPLQRKTRVSSDSVRSSENSFSVMQSGSLGESPPRDSKKQKTHSNTSGTSLPSAAARGELKGCGTTVACVASARETTPTLILPAEAKGYHGPPTRSVQTVLLAAPPQKPKSRHSMPVTKQESRHPTSIQPYPIAHIASPAQKNGQQFPQSVSNSLTSREATLTELLAQAVAMNELLEQELVVTREQLHRQTRVNGTVAPHMHDESVRWSLQLGEKPTSSSQTTPHRTGNRTPSCFTPTSALQPTNLASQRTASHAKTDRLNAMRVLQDAQVVLQCSGNKDPVRTVQELHHLLHSQSVCRTDVGRRSSPCGTLQPPPTRAGSRTRPADTVRLHKGSDNTPDLSCSRQHPCSPDTIMFGPLRRQELRNHKISGPPRATVLKPAPLVQRRSAHARTRSAATPTRKGDAVRWFGMSMDPGANGIPPHASSQPCRSSTPISRQLPPGGEAGLLKAMEDDYRYQSYRVLQQLEDMLRRS